MILWLVAGAHAQQIELGVGRAAVLEPGVKPDAVTLSDSVVVEVLPVAPALVLIGRKAGVTTLTIEHSRGVLEWSVTVHPMGDVTPSGTQVRPATDVLSLAVGEGVWCKVAGTTAMSFLDAGVGTISPIGTDRYLVQGDAAGVTDLLFETASGPKVVTVAVGDGPVKTPSVCKRPTETLELAIGEEKVVPVGRTVVGIDVGHPDIVFGKHAEKATDLLLIGMKPGTSIVLVRNTDDEDPWARRVVVAAPQ